MLRKILLSTALVAAAGSAVAADLPYRTSAPAPYVTAAPIFTWTGFYVGLNAGAAFNNNSNGGFTSTGFTAPNPVIYGGGGSSNKTGFTGGVTAGYNMQFGSFVAGVEGDINYLDRNHGGSAAVPFGGQGGGGSNQSYYYFGANQGGSSSNYFGTARARLGFAFDRFLVFGTGGFAFGGNSNGGSVDQYNATYSTPGTAGGTYTITRTPLASTGGNNSNVGYALGGGMEYAFSNSWSFKAEYLHVSLGNKNRTYIPTTGTPVNSFIYSNDKNKFDVVRVGLNYRF